MAAMQDTDMKDKLLEIWEQHEKAGAKGVPPGVQELLNSAFANVLVSSFPDLPSGEVVEVSGDDTIANTVSLLSEHNIMAAPVRNPGAASNDPWSVRYIGMVDYPAVVLWVIEQAELAAAALAAGSAAAVGVGAGAVGALGALVLGMTGPVALAGLATAAVGAAIAGGVIAERGVGKDPQTAANALGEDFYKVILQEEPFKSITVKEITRSYRWAPFLPIQPDDSMLTVLLLMSKFRLRSIPVIDAEKPAVENVLTQSAVVKGLAECQGRDWFDCIADKTLEQLGLPLMTPDKVISVDASKLILEAFILMREKGIGGLPVVEGPEKKVIGTISVRDVRFLLLKPEVFAQRKELTVLDFMNTITAASKDTASPSRCLPPITHQASVTLKEVISSLASKSAHRTYVVDEKSSVVGVVTIRDIISRFVTEPKGYFEEYFGGAVLETVDNTE
ncbi:unnamed protein product [Calypogeia fissa]